MKPRKHISFKWIISFLLVSLFTINNFTCKPDPISVEPPCIICPPDFRLTDFEPAWSPDGKTIAYVHGDTLIEKTGIYLIDTNGTNNRILYSSPGAYSPTWSPDGEWIAFSDNSQIYKIKVNGDSLTQLTTVGNNYFPSWSYNGEWITYDKSIEDNSGPAGIWIMGSDGQNYKRLFGASSPEWFPNNDSIISVRGINDYSIEKIFTIYSLFEEKIVGDIKGISNYDNLYPSISSNGEEILFTSGTPGNKYQIWKKGLLTNTTHQLTFDGGYSQDWAPNNDLIVYTDTRPKYGSLWIMNSNGENKKQLTFP